MVPPRSFSSPGPEAFPNKDSYKSLNNAAETIITGSETSTKLDSDKLKDANVGTTFLNYTPSSLKYEINKNDKQSSLEDANVKVQDPIGEDVKPPTLPLAGPSVMNIILVAAECAPWSKAGMSITREFSKREQDFPSSCSFACRSYYTYLIINT